MVILLINQNFSGMTGFRVLQQLRSHNVYNHTAFVFLSAHIPSGDDEAKPVALANDYIIKPISFVSLEKSGKIFYPDLAEKNARKTTISGIYKRSVAVFHKTVRLMDSIRTR